MFSIEFANNGFRRALNNMHLFHIARTEDRYEKDTEILSTDSIVKNSVTIVSHKILQWSGVAKKFRKISKGQFFPVESSLKERCLSFFVLQSHQVILSFFVPMINSHSFEKPLEAATCRVVSPQYLPALCNKATTFVRRDIYFA